MRLPLSAALLGGFLAASTCHALDYSKIERRIAKEPAYESDAPLYALLLFGREAEIRVWVVLDGETVYFDRNADGDLTAPDERFESRDKCRDVEITARSGETRYTLTGLNEYRVNKPPKVRLMASIRIDGPLAYDQYCGADAGESPETAGLAHFNGPLTVGTQTINGKPPPGLALTRGDKPEEIYAIIGTVDPEHGVWTVVRTHKGDKSAFAEGVSPEIKVVFPAKEGDEPIKQTFPLSGFC